jgi:UDP-glucose 4-epimerase
MAIRKKRQETIVVTGISSRTGRMLARAFHQEFQFIGIDARGARHMPKDVTVHAIDIRRKKAEDIFRRNTIDAVVHLNPEAEFSGSQTEHRNLTVLGTQRILDFCQKYHVPKVVLLSSGNIYGPAPWNNQFLTEESALMAGQRFPTMRNLVEVDMYAQSFFWRHPEIDTVILRPCNVVGRLKNHASLYLMLHNTPTLMGFDPMVQVMSPEDLIHAIRLALKPGVRGVFNLAGASPAPLSEIIRRLGHRNWPVPEPMARMAIAMASGVGMTRVPTAELDYLKYVCMVDDSRAREELRYQPLTTLDQTLTPLRG